MPNPFDGPGDAAGLRFAVVVARFNEKITQTLLDGALRQLHARGAASNAIDVFWVPGAFEIPLLARTAARSGRYAAVLCLGAVIRGETDHATLIAAEAARGIAQTALDTEVPCIFEVLSTATRDLAMARAGGPRGNRGEAAADAAVHAARVLEQARSLPPLG